MVWLHGQIDQVGKAVEWLEKARKVWTSNLEKMTDETSVLKQLAAFKLLSNRPREAAADYERIVKNDPSDLKAVAGLIAAYSEFDINLAEKYSSYLPETSEAGATEDTLNVDELENNVSWVIGKKTMANVPDMKRKRKHIIPKNFIYDPNFKPNPERWLPKRERTAYLLQQKKKGRKGEDQLFRGPQGASVAGGGIGGTGSANFGAKKQIKEKAQPVVEVKSPQPEVQVSPKPTQKSSSKKKGKK
ncbi:Signal recognition particle core component [Nowakowskiella sp. JEL0078]|nr:Signal recognition particle core component [Nowakowskiella sp. JEL0078]